MPSYHPQVFGGMSLTSGVLDDFFYVNCVTIVPGAAQK
jgi:hypothetical protein